MKRITRWSPDTCGCVIDFEWDDENSSIPHKAKNIISECEAHKGLDKDSCYLSVLEENKYKNVVINKIANTIPSLALISSSGVPYPNMDKISFSFDKNRKIIIKAQGATSAQKSKISLIIEDESIG